MRHVLAGMLLVAVGCSDGGDTTTADAGPEGRVDATAGADARAGAPLTPVLQSDFATATGTAAMALDDGGLWAVYGTGGEVLANPGDLGFPAGLANVLRVSWSQGTGIWRVGPPFGPGLPALAVGSTRYYRYYFRQVQPDGTVDTQTHPFQDGGAGSQTNWTMQCFNNVGAGMWLLGHGFWGNAFPYDQFHLSTPLPKAHTYRLEHAIERVSATTYRFDSRVYDEAVSVDTPIYDGDDFYAAGQPARGSMTAYFATQTLTFNDPVNLDGFNAGVNDIEPTEPGDYAFQGGFAIADDQGWIGPYGTVAGEP